MSDQLLQVTNLNKRFGNAKKGVQAVNNVSFEMKIGESLGLVGESGSGKSTIGNMICGLVQPTSGEILLDQQPIYKGRKYIRDTWRSVQMVFQDPYGSLNPTMTIEEIVAEPLRLWLGKSAEEAKSEVSSLLEQVGLDPAMAHGYPAKLSGGQRQRVSIARALAPSPRLIVCDESVSALDVSVQAQILALLKELKENTGVSYLFISHDIGVVRLIADRVLVLSEGVLVETVAGDSLTRDKVSHPYTQKLLAAVPTLGPSRVDGQASTGAVVVSPTLGKDHQ
jgi:ABC-type glutathione transport system ATPase component